MPHAGRIECNFSPGAKNNPNEGVFTGYFILLGQSMFAIKKTAQHKCLLTLIIDVL